MVVRPQRQEVQQVVQVNLPVPLRVEVEREVHAGELTREAALLLVTRRSGRRLVQQLLVVVVGALGVLAQQLLHARGFVRRELRAAALAVGLGLRPQDVGVRHVELTIEDRVAGGVLVDVGRAMPDPLARDEDRELDVQLDLAHLEGRRVPVAHEVADQPSVVRPAPGAASIRDARRLHDRAVVTHVIDDPHEPVIEDRHGRVQEIFEGRDSGTLRLVPLRSQSLQLGSLLWRHEVGRGAHLCTLRLVAAPSRIAVGVEPGPYPTPPHWPAPRTRLTLTLSAP